MSTPDPTAMVIRRPADLLGAVPYLVGFHPSDSAVIVGLDEYRITFTARIDLPGPGNDLDQYQEFVAAHHRNPCPGGAASSGAHPRPLPISGTSRPASPKARGRAA